jgi:hypothetical protein
VTFLLFSAADPAGNGQINSEFYRKRTGNREFSVESYCPRGTATENGGRDFNAKAPEAAQWRLRHPVTIYRASQSVSLTADF